MLITGNGLVATALSGKRISTQDIDLREFQQTLVLFKEIQPTEIIHTAGRVGGLGGNMNYKGEFFFDNIMINTNVIEAARQTGVKKVVSFLESRFQDMTTYIREKGVKRNSLAETGIRCLRRLERGHDGFRGKEGLDCYVRIYQAVKYLGWSVHRITQSDLGLPGRIDNIGPPDDSMESIAS